MARKRRKRGRRRRAGGVQRLARRLALRLKLYGTVFRIALSIALTLARLYRIVSSVRPCRCDVILETDFLVDLYSPKSAEEWRCAARVLKLVGSLTLCATPVTAYELKRAGIRIDIPVCRRGGSVARMLAAWAVDVLKRGITSENTMRDLLSLYTAPETARYIITSDKAQCRRAAKFGLKCIRHKGRGVCP